MITLLISILVIALLYWAITAVLAAAGIGEPVATIVKVVAVLAIVYVILTAFGLVPRLQ